MKKVLLKIKGSQIIDGQSDTTEIIVEGTFREFDGDYIITYYDDQMVENTKIKNKFTLKSDNTAILERVGEMNSKFVITEGVRNVCLYDLPPLAMTLGVFGKEVQSNLNEHGGKIKMVYTLDSNLRVFSENEVEISVEER